MLGSNEVMVRLAWVTMMGLVEIGVGHHMVGWFFWVSDGFIYLFLIWVFVLVGFWGAVGSGGVVGMWRQHGFLIGGWGIFVIFLGIFDGLGFKSAAWVSDRWVRFANRWLGWWVWWPLLAPTGLMVCVCVALLKV